MQKEVKNGKRLPARLALNERMQPYILLVPRTISCILTERLALNERMQLKGID